MVERFPLVIRRETSAQHTHTHTHQHARKFLCLLVFLVSRRRRSRRRQLGRVSALTMVISRPTPFPPIRRFSQHRPILYTIPYYVYM